jgi:hypothetical protein
LNPNQFRTSMPESISIFALNPGAQEGDNRALSHPALPSHE